MFVFRSCLIETIYSKVADICDRNGDNFVTVPEFVVGFAEILSYSCK